MKGRTAPDAYQCTVLGTIAIDMVDNQSAELGFSTART
jgi:hypothetical protein